MAFSVKALMLPVAQYSKHIGLNLRVCFVCQDPVTQCTPYWLVPGIISNIVFNRRYT